MVRQARRGHARRFGDQALRAGNQVQAQRIFNGFRLHKRSVLDVACLRETLAGKHGRNRAGKHQHIAVKPQLNIRHGNILSTPSMIPKAAHAMRRAARAHINDARARAKRTEGLLTGASRLATQQILLLTWGNADEFLRREENGNEKVTARPGHSPTVHARIIPKSPAAHVHFKTRRYNKTCKRNIPFPPLACFP